MTEEKPVGPAPEKQLRDGWDKAQILAPVMMPLALFILGWWGNNVLQRDQERRAFVELLSRREEADSTLRKDMFAKVIDQFIGQKVPSDLDTRILHLELLAYNFHESIDLGPLLKQVYEESWRSRQATSAQRKRLHRLAMDIVAREVEALRDWGCVLEGSVDFDELLQKNVLVGVIKKSCGSNGPELPGKWFRVDVMTNPEATDVRRQTEFDVMLSIRHSEDASSQEKRVEFTVSPFDFPMIDNVRLEDRTRASVVMTRVHDGGVTLSLVYFPASRTSLKDKPFHDEVLRMLNHTPAGH
jgi:hypothetical protein